MAYKDNPDIETFFLSETPDNNRADFFNAHIESLKPELERAFQSLIQNSFASLQFSDFSAVKIEKEDGGIIVARLPIQLTLNSINTLLSNTHISVLRDFYRSLGNLSTNKRVVERIAGVLKSAQHVMSEEAFKSINNDITLYGFALANGWSPEKQNQMTIYLEELRLLNKNAKGSLTIDANKLRKLRGGRFEVTIPLDIVMKRVPSRTKARQEVESYQILAEYRSDAVTALRLVEEPPEDGDDSQGHSTIYTFYEDMTLGSQVPNMFKERPGFFGSLMEYLTNLHTNRVTHGDLNAKNYGFKIIAGTIVILSMFGLSPIALDPANLRRVEDMLDKTSRGNPDSNQFFQNLRAELTLLNSVNNGLLFIANRQHLTNEDKLYCQACIEKYIARVKESLLPADESQIEATDRSYVAAVEAMIRSQFDFFLK